MDTRERLTKTIQNVLTNQAIQVEQIYLFGSRVGETAHPDSDWDVYVLINRELSFSERQQLTTEIKRELAQQRIPNDVLLKSTKQFHASKSYPGHIAYTVAQEGIPL